MEKHTAEYIRNRLLAEVQDDAAKDVLKEYLRGEIPPEREEIDFNKPGPHTPKITKPSEQIVREMLEEINRLGYTLRQELSKGND